MYMYHHFPCTCMRHFGCDVRMRKTSPSSTFVNQRKQRSRISSKMHNSLEYENWNFGDVGDRCDRSLTRVDGIVRTPCTNNTSGVHASEDLALFGKEWSPSLHKEFVVTPKPKPRTRATLRTSQSLDLPRHNKVATPYNPVMAHETGATLTLPLPINNKETVRENGSNHEEEVKRPVAPPRTKRNIKRSPLTIRTSLPPTSKPPKPQLPPKPDFIPAKAFAKAPKPRPITPRRRGVVSESNRRASEGSMRSSTDTMFANGGIHKGIVDDSRTFSAPATPEKRSTISTSEINATSFTAKRKQSKSSTGASLSSSPESPSHVLPRATGAEVAPMGDGAPSNPIDLCETPPTSGDEGSGSNTKTCVRRLTMYFEEQEHSPLHTTRRFSISSGEVALNRIKGPAPFPRTSKTLGREELSASISSEILQHNTSHTSLMAKPAHLTISTTSVSELGTDDEAPQEDDVRKSRKASSCSPPAVHRKLQISKSLAETDESLPDEKLEISTPDGRTVKLLNVPPKPLTKKKISASAAEILDSRSSSLGRTDLQVVVSGLNDTADQEKIKEVEVHGERVKIETQFSQPPLRSHYSSLRATESLPMSKRAASVGDIPTSLEVAHHQIHIGYSASEVSSYTSSLSFDTCSILERAKQLSLNKKWCEQPEVKESGILSDLTKEQIFLQEAIFEVLTSEATYHLNLAMLIDHFMDDPKMYPSGFEPDHVLDRTQHSTIFSNVKEIRKVSSRFLDEILGLFCVDVSLRGIFPILEDYAVNRFMCYERYCASQSHRLKEIRMCTEKSDGFKKLLTKLEEEANQTLQSLVTAPMQRITKLPLLMKEILKRTPLDDPNRVQMEATHRATQEIADLCNKGAGKIGDLMSLETIWKKLNFGQLKPFLILSPGRRLKREGAIERLKVNKRRSRVMPEKVQHYLFVFTDILLITTEEKDRHHVVDYCLMEKVTVDSLHTSSVNSLESSFSGDDSYTMSGAEWTVAVAGEEHAFLVTLQDSAVLNGKQGPVENSYIFVVRSETEKRSWMDILKEKNTREVTIGPPRTLYLKMLKKKRKKNTAPKKHWWKQPLVEQSGIVKTMSQQQLELQEAIFEVITSEEEHLIAMETLIKHYMCDSGLDPSLPEEQRVLSEEEYNDIFRNIYDVRDVSAGLFKILTERQRESVKVDTISDILLLCVERKFQAYIRYCTNLPNQMDQLDISLEKNESFNGYLKQLEEDQQPLRSLLNAPMERIRKYPGLIKNILKKTPPSSLNYSLVESTLRAVQKVEKLCVRGQKKMTRIKELHSLERQLDFGSFKPFSLFAAGRTLLRKGSLTKLRVGQWFGKKTVKRRQNYLIITNDYVLITKRIENAYKVMDMSPLDRVLVETVEPHTLDQSISMTGGGEDTMPGARWAVSKAGENHAFLMSFPDVKRSYTFITDSEEERMQWIESLTVQNLMSFEDEEDTMLIWDYFHMKAITDYCPSENGAPAGMELKEGDILRVYRLTDGWCEGLRTRDLHWGKVPTLCLTPCQGEDEEESEDSEVGRTCTQLVEATYDFPGNSPGELPLEKGDIVKIVRQMEGWYEGMKLCSNKWGWFPGNFTRTLNSRSISHT